jgi:phospholipid/cholesterol/gamma-HCH transport system permease protein
MQESQSNNEISWQQRDGRYLFEGVITYENADMVFRSFVKILEKSQGSCVLDFSKLTRIDSAGVATLVELTKVAKQHRTQLKIEQASEDIRKTFAMLPGDMRLPSPAKPLPFFEILADFIFGALDDLLKIFLLMTDICYWAIIAPCRGKWVKFSAVVEQAIFIGADAVPIISLTSFLVGLTLALLSSYQLREFGANIYVANLIGLGMTREMGPLMSAIIVAGRSGSAIAAEIATMSVSEELDALKTMGINPIRFVVIPKLYAISLTQPLLTVMADLTGIFGGLAIASLMLDVSVNVYFKQLFSTLFLEDILTGLVKSVAFAWIIVFVGVNRGFNVSGGARGVGLVTTSSVVVSLFLVIIADCFFSLLFYFF